MFIPLNSTYESQFKEVKFKFYSTYTKPFPIPLIEKTIQQISYNIRCKESWVKKFKDPEISSKWKEEIRDDLTIKKSKNIDDIINYVFEELNYYESIEAKTDYVYHVGYNDHVFYADDVIPTNVKRSFVKNSKFLEENEEIDYHPRSNNQVIDLVHPSLFPLIYDRSTSETSVISKDFRSENTWNFSVVNSAYQWLPSIFKLDNSVGKYKIDSYINNLHPIKYKSLYKDIEDIFDCILPGFEMTLSRSLGEDRATGIVMPYASKDVIYDDYLTTEIRKKHEYADAHEDELDKVLEEVDHLEKSLGREHLKPLQTFVYPGPPQVVEVNLKEFFAELKVIVKMANIELSPESPNYPGGSWHVEGCDNEKIIASAIYYYESENIDESRLQFCQPMGEVENYEQDAEQAVFNLYGMKREDSLMVDQGDVLAQKDRVVIFPNFLHHRVKPFGLKNPLMHGHRKILCFFLVDPLHREPPVLSTRDIPPQQKSWWDENNEDIISESTKQHVVHLVENDKDKVPFDLDEAKDIREKLMAERVTAIKSNFESSYTFSLCEH